MSKKAGLRFEIIVTTSRYDKKFDPKFESWNFLNEVLLYYPTIDKYMLPENAAYRLGIVPLQFAGNSGLFIKEMELGGTTSGVSMVQEIPVPGAEVSHHDMEVSISFDNTASKVTQHAKHIHSGYTTLNYRPAYFYLPEEKRKEFLEEILKSSIEGAKVSNIKTQNSNLNSAEAEKEFIVEGDVTYSSLIEKADNSFLFKVGAVIGPQTELYQEKPRQNTIDIVYPHVLDREITIAIPNGYQVKGLDALAINITGGDPKAPTMGFVSEYKLEGDKLKIKVHEYYNKQEYSVNQYEEFRKVINAAADFNKITILFEKKS
jgi:hypothetical protein